MEKNKFNFGKLKRVQKQAINKTREMLNYEPTKILFKVLAENTGAIQKAIKDPTPLNFFLTAGGLCNSLYNSLEVHSTDFFEDGSWEFIMNSSIVSLFTSALNSNAESIEQFTVSDKQNRIKIFHFNQDGVKFSYGCLVYPNEAVSHLYLKGDIDGSKAKDILCKIFWNEHKYSSILITVQKTLTNRWNDSTDLLTAIQDTNITPMSSELATKQVENIKRAMDHGIHRAILYYGPPGTGKSTLCRSIISTLGLTSVRIRYNDLSNNSDMWNIICSISSDAIIIDDIDRCETEKLLELLENLQKLTKVVLATANSRNHIDEACLRPGRFDELVNVKHLDGNVVREILGKDLSEQAFETVKLWPVAFIQEYKKRRTYMSHEEAIDTMKELSERVSRLSKYDEDSEDEDNIKIFSKIAKPGKRKKALSPW